MGCMSKVMGAENFCPKRVAWHRVYSRPPQGAGFSVFEKELHK